MKFKLEIDMDNAAFEDGQAHETGFIIRQLGARLYNQMTFGPNDKRDGLLYDRNGNKVGEWKVTQ